MTIVRSEENLFQCLGLSPSVLNTLSTLQYLKPTPIQNEAIPVVLSGKDLMACAQTGTGKTAAFALPLLERLAKTPSSKKMRVLVLTPTRELAIQVYENFKAYGTSFNLRYVLVTGGMNENRQLQDLKQGVDVVIATPGRLVDFMNRNLVTLSTVEALVLDEADRMLDMGFLPDVKRILKKVPQSRQTLLFSATFPKEIEKLAQEMLRNPTRVSVAPPSTPSANVQQSVYNVDSKEKQNLLGQLMLDEALSKVIIFTRTKHRANKLCKYLDSERIACAPMHSNKSQNARQKALADFKNGSIRVLVASDIASRGIDVDEISHVINFDMPDTAETYVHRIGRTGRASAQGVALSFCSPDESDNLRAIEKLMKKSLTRVSYKVTTKKTIESVDQWFANENSFEGG